MTMKTHWKKRFERWKGISHLGGQGVCRAWGEMRRLWSKGQVSFQSFRFQSFQTWSSECLGSTHLGPPHPGSPCLGLSWPGCIPKEGLLECVMLGQHCLHSQARQSLGLCWRPWKSWKPGCLHPRYIPWYVESHMQTVWVCLGCCNKTHRLGLKQQILIAHSFGDHKSKIKVWAGLVPSEASLLACRWLSFPCVLTRSFLYMYLCNLLFLQEHQSDCIKANDPNWIG